MDVITRAEAKAKGLKRFFTGEPWAVAPMLADGGRQEAPLLLDSRPGPILHLTASVGVSILPLVPTLLVWRDVDDRLVVGLDEAPLRRAISGRAAAG